MVGAIVLLCSNHTMRSSNLLSKEQPQVSALFLVLRVAPARFEIPKTRVSGLHRYYILRAEEVGFEPTVELPLHRISSAAPSTTQPLLLYSRYPSIFGIENVG